MNDPGTDAPPPLRARLATVAAAIPFAEAVASQLTGPAGPLAPALASAGERGALEDEVAEILLSLRDGPADPALVARLERAPELAAAFFQNVDLLYHHRWSGADAVSTLVMRVVERASDAPNLHRIGGHPSGPGAVRGILSSEESNMPTRKANAIWEGGLKGGKGSFSGESGAISAAYSFGTRFENDPGTNPEELLAAAEAACYSMALSGALEGAGTPPERVETEAACTIEKVDDGFKITTMRLRVRARVPGVDPAAFQKAVQDTKTGCPVSRALTGVKIEVEATLE